MTIPVWHDRERSILIYGTPKPLDIARVVPNSFQLYNGYVGVPITLQNLQRLRSIDYPVIAPMEDRYDWPGLYTPFMAQRGTSNFLTLHPRAFCLNDMGTGKTLACLWAADYVMLQHPPKTFKWLIVAPLSTLRTVWGDAIFQNFMGRRSYSVLHGTAAQREAALARDADFYIINHDGLGVGFGEKNRKPELRSLAAMLANRSDIQGVIIDECSAYRDATTRRHKVARHLLGQRAYLWLLSGTPTANGPLDAYGQAKLVNGAYGESFTHYKTRVMMQVSQFKWMPKAGSDVEAKKLLSPAVRYKISDCIDLPPCTVQHREAPLSTEQMQYYKQMKTQLKLELKKGAQVNAVSEGVLRMKLIQIACGAVYDGEHVAHHLDAKPRLAVLQELIDACQDKMIIFAPLTSVVNMVHDFIPGSVIVNGSVKPKDRTEIFRAFQQDDFPRYMVADPHTMAHGVTLTAATTIVWFAPIDKTEIYLQANKRIDRPGQTKNTTIVQISATPVEREIYRRLEANESMQGAILKLAE